MGPEAGASGLARGAVTAHAGFGLEALRRARDEAAHPRRRETPQPSLEQVPPDAPYEDPNAVLHVWNGERWVPWEKWLAAAPIATEAPHADRSTITGTAECVAGECGGTQVWLVREGDRWRMYAGSRKPSGRKEFASPFLAHAMRTAEQWYGAPDGGWREETSGDGSRRNKAADLHPQDATAERVAE